MKNRSIILAGILGLFALLVSPLTAQAQKTVKVAATSKVVVDNLVQFVGVHMGFFKEEGLKLDISYFRGGGAVVRGITTGSTDIATTPSASAVYIAASKGVPLKIVGGSGAPLAGVVWVVPPSSPIKSIMDLKGKKVGFSRPGSLTHTVIQTALRKVGLDGQVELVPMGRPGDNWAAVKNGIIASGWHVSPVVYKLIAAKEARVLINASDYVKNYQQSVVTVMESVIKKDPDMIRSFLKARAKAVKFISENPEKTASIWAKELKIPESATRLAIKALPKGYFEAEAPKMKNLKAVLDEVMAAGMIKKSIDLNKLLDLRFLPKM